MLSCLNWRKQSIIIVEAVDDLIIFVDIAHRTIKCWICQYCGQDVFPEVKYCTVEMSWWNSLHSLRWNFLELSILYFFIWYFCLVQWTWYFTTHGFSCGANYRKGRLFLPIHLSSVQAEEARIAQEIQKKREKDGRDTELDKRKMMVS